ncbi:glycosyltransferase [Piscinibacter sakaiensis]|uniref:glycosyltransferase n=1 Tax=Piscinibacter sakaiensis TaxID=1547922 RepID=UPI003AAF9E4A
MKLPQDQDLVTNSHPPGETAPTVLLPLHIGKFVPPPFAGIESHVDTLLRSLTPQVDATLVASELPTRSPVPREPTPYRLLACPSYGTVASVAVSPSLRGVVKREFNEGRANLLHVHAPNPWGDLAALDSHIDTPVVMTWHSDVVRKPALFKLYSRIQQKALRRVDRVVIFTPKHFESSAQLHVADVEHKLVEISIGIDFGRLDSTASVPEVEASLDQWAQGRPIALSVGRQVPYKGYRHLIRAMSMLRGDAVLLMIGTGPLGSALKREAAELGLGDRVRFLGEVDLPTLVTALRRCDIFCLPSIERSESFGIASAEAMAYGKPTVVCELNNGVNYLNRHRETSLVTPPRDERALADAIDQLVDNAALRRQFGEAARAWVRTTFSVEQMRDDTLAMYRSLM